MKIGLHVIRSGLDGRTDELKRHAAALNGACHKFVNPRDDRQLLRELMQATPASEWVLRDHPLSEQKADLTADPEGTGRRHAQEWARQLDELGLRADGRVLVEGINEYVPHVWRYEGTPARKVERLPRPNDADRLDRYSAAFLVECTRLNIRGCIMALNVGWPDNGLDPASPPDYNYFALTLAALKANPRHGLSIHEYFPGTPGATWGWHAGRITKWRALVEAGIAVYVTEGGTDNVIDNGKRGWREWGLAPDQIAARCYEHARALVAAGVNLKGYHPFTTGGEGEWASFMMQGAANEAVSQLPEIPVGAPAPVPPPAPQPTPQPGGLPAPVLENWPAEFAVVPPTVAPGAQYWRLVKARMNDHRDDLVHIFWMEPKNPAARMVILNRGNGREESHPLDKTGEVYARDWPMGRAIPDGNKYDTWMAGAPSWRVNNLHLIGNRHIYVELWWELATAPASIPTPPAPVPVPPPPVPGPGAVKHWDKPRWAIERGAAILEAEGFTAEAAWLLACDSYQLAKLREEAGK